MTRFTARAGFALLVAVATSQPLPGRAADTAKSGKAVFDAYVTWHYATTIDSGVDKGMTGEATGFDVLVSGDPGFPDKMTFRCLGYFHAVGDDFAGNGSCVKTDKAGDNFSYLFTPDGKFSWAGGTGKYKGMSGGGTTKVLWDHELPNGDWAGVIRHEATFAIP